jgi:hypothetical protein
MDRCVGVFALQLHFANCQVIARERQFFADEWRNKGKQKKKKKALKDRHYAFTVSNIFLVFVRENIPFFADLGCWAQWIKKIRKGPKQSTARIRSATK